MAPAPLTLLSPVPWWWALWIRLSWPAARMTPFVAAPLRRLSFIHAGRWALVGRWPPDRGGRRDRGPQQSVLFLTTFDGTALQYIEAFVRVVPWRIRGLYAGATGFPAVRHARDVIAYVEANAQTVDHFWCALPDATVTMKRRALELTALHAEFAARVQGADADAFAVAWQDFVTRAQGLL